MEQSPSTKVETTNASETSSDHKEVNTVSAGKKEHVISMGQSHSTKLETTNGGETNRNDEEVNTAIPEIEEHAIPMEQSLSTRFETTEVGETSRDNEEIEHTADRASDIYLRFKLDNDDQLIRPKLDNDVNSYVSCPRVLKLLRDDYEYDYSFYSHRHCYDPKFVSFGPYHHGKSELKAAERIKRKIMKEFISIYGIKIEDLYIEVLEQNDHARSCYEDGSTSDYTDDEFALMMLQDGCFILALSEYKVYETLVSKYLDILQRRYSLLDMILLENQIPFRVLNVLMSNIYGGNRGLKMITSFLRNMHWGNILEQDTPDQAEEPDHLLGLQASLISKCDCPGKIYPQDFPSFFPSFGSVSDLQAKGINFKPSNSISLLSAKKKIPKSISLRDVKFRPGFFTGELIVPPLLLTPDALVYYKNLIAFEMCAIFIDATITSYISFMNSLIATPEDVKVLRSKHIILHTLNSDEEVFKTLKGISGAKWRPDVFIYQGVRNDIQKHYNSKIRTWIAVIRHKYFSQQWSVFGLLAAVVAIILSFLQTFYTIHPRKG